MHNPYITITQITHLNFTNCEGCLTPCCDGSRFLFAPMILDDFDEVYQNFPIVFAKISDELRILMVLSKEDGPCRHYENKQCSIYDKRPPSCRLYPLNPFDDDILIDTTCKALSDNDGVFFASNNSINSQFYHKRLENFKSKREDTARYLQTIVHDLTVIGELGGLLLYKYTGALKDKYIDMHRSSLKMKWKFQP